MSSAAGELVFGSVVVESSSNCGYNLVPGAASVDVSWSWTVASKWAIRRGLGGVRGTDGTLELEDPGWSSDHPY